MLSYFNSEQQGEMAMLDGLPPEQKCYCGWYRLGQCDTCPPEKTCADKIAAQCPECRNAPHFSDSEITHTIACSRRHQP